MAYRRIPDSCTVVTAARDQAAFRGNGVQRTGFAAQDRSVRQALIYFVSMVTLGKVYEVQYSENQDTTKHIL